MNDPENSLENLLVSLIKMIGKTNEKFDDLNKRVQQLEWCMKNITLQDKNKTMFTVIKGHDQQKAENSVEKHYTITI